MAIHEIMYGETFAGLQNEIKLQRQKQAVIAYNIANLGTPGFTPLPFSEELRVAESALTAKDEKAKLEELMGEMDAAKDKYSASIRLLTLRMGALRSVVTLGK